MQKEKAVDKQQSTIQIFLALRLHERVPLFLQKTQACLVLGGTVSCQQG